MVPNPRCLLVAVIIGLSIGCSTPRRAASDEGSAPEPPAKALTISSFVEIGGTQYSVADVVEPVRGASFSSEGYGSGRRRNLIFLDRTSLQSHRLFVANGDVILEMTQLGRGKPSSTDAASSTLAPVRWLMLEVVHSDTNQDGVLGPGDRFALGFTDAFGQGYSEPLPNVERLLGTAMVNDDQVMIAYVVDGKASACRIDLPTKAVQATAPLADLTGVPGAPSN